MLQRRCNLFVLLLLYGCCNLLQNGCNGQQHVPVNTGANVPPSADIPSAPAFRDEKEIHNQEHIKQHLEDQVEVDTSKMTQEQLEFHYFNMYDTDKNGMIDGIEVVKAVTHTHSHSGSEDTQHAPESRMSDIEIEKLVDETMTEYDFSNDGYIDYTEFINKNKK